MAYRYPLVADVLREQAMKQNPSLSARRAPDFKDTGGYEVVDDTGSVIAIIYRDPESREWYQDVPGKHFSDCWIGSTKNEAVERIASRHARKNPGHRVPTLEEIAGAYAYISSEYKIEDGRIDGEMWAEGLANADTRVRDLEGAKRVDPTWYAEMMAVAREVRPQLTDQQWTLLAARADYIRANHYMGEHSRPRYKANPSAGTARLCLCDKPSAPSGRSCKCGGLVAEIERDDAKAAIERYKTFHRYDPKDIGAFPASFRIPARLKCVGPAKWVTYRSGKVDPATGKLPKKPVNYIHEHDAGVHAYVPESDRDFDELEGDIVDVPEEFREVSALAKLGESLGFCVKVDDGELEVENEKPLPELYCSADGKCLYVIQDKREVLAMIWGGALGVFARGIDG